LRTWKDSFVSDAPDFDDGGSQLERDRQASFARRLSSLQLACAEAIEDARLRRELNVFLDQLLGRA